jgi:hypothetical protein
MLQVAFPAAEGTLRGVLGMAGPMLWPGSDDRRWCEAVKRSEYRGDLWGGQESSWSLLGGWWIESRRGVTPTVLAS